MSSRALRKLQQQQELEAEKAKAKAQEDNKNVDEEDSEENATIGTGSNLGARAKMPPHRNPFDLVSIWKIFVVVFSIFQMLPDLIFL